MLIPMMIVGRLRCLKPGRKLLERTVFCRANRTTGINISRYATNSNFNLFPQSTVSRAYNTAFEDNDPLISDEEAEKMLSTWPTTYHQPISTIVAAILKDKTYRTYINAQALDYVNWENFVNSRRRALIISPLSVLGTVSEVARFKELLDEAFFEDNQLNAQSSNKTSSSFLYCKQMLFDLLLKKAEVSLKDVMDTNKVLAMASDLRIPHEWYPHARIMKRKIFYHGGPTNSGKVSYCFTHITMMLLVLC